MLPQGPAVTIAAAGLAACALASMCVAAELPIPASETGEYRELVNRPDCWTGDIARAWDRCALFTTR